MFNQTILCAVCLMTYHVLSTRKSWEMTFLVYITDIDQQRALALDTWPIPDIV